MCINCNFHLCNSQIVSVAIGLSCSCDSIAITACSSSPGPPPAPIKPPISAGPSGPRSPAKAEAAVTDDFLARERHSTTTMPSSARSPANAEAVVTDRKHPTKINLCCPCTPSSMRLVLRSDRWGAGNICLLPVPSSHPSQPSSSNHHGSASPPSLRRGCVSLPRSSSPGRQAVDS